MREQEQDYPKHQSRHGEHEDHDPFLLQEEKAEEKRPRVDSLHQRESALMPQLPVGYASKALIVGVILGILVSLQGIILTLTHTDLYREAARYTQTSMPLGLASSIFGIFALGLAISALIYLLGGLVIGKISVRRRWAFIGGFVGGVLSSIIGAILKLIPAYPNASNSGIGGSPLGVGGGFAVLIISFIILGVLAGLVSLLGSWLVTRRHPYYMGYES